MHCLNSEHCNFGGGVLQVGCVAMTVIFRHRYFNILMGIQNTNGSKKSLYLELRIIMNS